MGVNWVGEKKITIRGGGKRKSVTSAWFRFWKSIAGLEWGIYCSRDLWLTSDLGDRPGLSLKQEKEGTKINKKKNVMPLMGVGGEVLFFN